ncbi:2'-5' RNA ligase family protein [Treponema sp.]|uniref:2'-5' RNA ligase family protein n=1 Tax=Treponema sp. TaxID=166 RepID=UPI003F04D8F8
MKNKNNNRGGGNFPQQTHFIGVLLPEDITLTLEDCRRYMREAYGCKSDHATPIHVTLVPPFRLPDEYSTGDLARAIENEVIPKGLGFTAHINNFDAFGDRTLFAKVVTDEKWVALRDAVFSAVIKAAPGCTKKDGRPFQGHISVSNRDIPTGVMTGALQVMNELNLAEDFPVDNVTIFERQNGKWVSAVSLIF